MADRPNVLLMAYPNPYAESVQKGRYSPTDLRPPCARRPTPPQHEERPPIGNRQRARRRRAAAANTTRRRYWLTPKAASRRCSHCHALGAVAYRPADHKVACAECIDRLGIKAHESAAWRDAGRKPYAPVTVRFVDPATLRATETDGTMAA